MNNLFPVFKLMTVYSKNGKHYVRSYEFLFIHANISKLYEKNDYCRRFLLRIQYSCLSPPASNSY